MFEHNLQYLPDLIKHYSHLFLYSNQRTSDQNKTIACVRNAVASAHAHTHKASYTTKYM